MANENVLDTGTDGTDLVMNDLALRDTASFTEESSDWTIYFHPGIRFGTDDRVIGFYDLMVPVYFTDTSMLFVNPRFSHDSTDGYEWNLGGGYRQILWDNQLMLGINAYYDLKKHGESGLWFDQWGMGLEAMGEFDEVLSAGGGLGLTGRFNFYIPIEEARHSDVSGHIFKSLGIYDATADGTIYEPLTGLDYEMGMRIPYLSEYVETWVYAGGYHYRGRESGHLDGFCGRIEVIPTDFLSLDFEYRHDNWYGDEFYGEVKVEVPFSIENLVKGKNPFEGLGGRFGGSRDLKARMVEPVRRDIDIRVKKVIVEDWKDGTGVGSMVEEVIFVSEGAAAGTGDGSFEHPYSSIDEALGDARLGVTAFIIHVINDNGGDGVAGGGDFTGAGAVADLLVWGSGTNHPVYPVIFNMTSGFPEMNTTLITDDAGAEIMGIYFNSGGGAGLEVRGGPGTIVHDNRFNVDGAHGVLLSGFNGVSVYDNVFEGPASVNSGVFLSGGSGADIYNNTFNGYRGIGGDDGTDIVVTGNTFNTTEYGIGLSYGGSNIVDISIFENTFSTYNPAGDAAGIGLETTGGFDIGAAGNPVSIYDNIMNVAGTNDVVGIGCNSDGDLFVDITGNDLTGGITGGGSAAGMVLYATGSIGSSGNPALLDLNRMIVTNNTGDAFGMYLRAGGNLFADVTNNNLAGGITGGGEAYGISLGAGNIGFDGTTTTPVLLDNNRMAVTSNGSGAYGLFLYAADSIFADVTNNDLTGGIIGDSFTCGIYYSSITNVGSAAIPVLLNGNDMTITSRSNVAIGMYLHADDFLFADITNNGLVGGMTVTGNTEASGIYLDNCGSIGYDGTTTAPALLDNNRITVTSSAGNAVGLFISVFDILFADITNNNLTGGITGRGNAYGIRLFSNSGYFGSSGNHVLLDNNRMAVTAITGYAYGANLYTGGYLFADAKNNDLTGGITGDSYAYGIYYSSASGNIGFDGTTISPVLLDNNRMTVTSNGSYAYGLYLYTPNSLFASITNNNLTGGITGSTITYGISMYSASGDIGSDGNHVLLDNNSMTVRSITDVAYGMRLYARNDLFADVTNNDLTGGISGVADIYGIALSSNSNIGIATAPVLLDGNLMTVTSNTGTAYGMYLVANSALFADVKNNNLTGGITGVNAYGAFMRTVSSTIGDATCSTFFQNNTGTIYGDTSRYMLYLMTGNVGGGNVVGWSGNVFTSSGGDGTWDGNYIAGDGLPRPSADENKPVYTNFGGGDTLNP